MLKILGLIAAIVIGGTGQASAADLFGSPTGYGACPTVESAQELVSYTDRRALKDAVHNRYLEAVEVSNSRKAYFSTNPLFLWANEAKSTCAKAYGYLRKRLGWQRASYSMVQKCDCFYLRMQDYASGR